MPGVTRTVTKSRDRLERWARALRAAKLAAVKVAAENPHDLIGEAAKRQRDEIEEDIRFLEHAESVTFTVPEESGSER